MIKLLTKTLIITILSLSACTTYKPLPPVDTINNIKFTKLNVEITKNKQPVFKSDKQGTNLLFEVNDYVNKRISYKLEKPGRDVWQTPLTTERLKTGDCEDYVIYKHELLKQNGIDPKNMKFIIGETANNEEHAILEVRIKNNIYHLDNRDFHIKGNTITKPIYTINPYGMTMFKKE